MSALHNQDKNGFAGLDQTLTDRGFSVTSAQVLHDFLASMALDKALDTRTLVGEGAGRTAALKTASLNAHINWDTPQAYSTSGAPTNGADWVKVTDGSAVTFDGAEGYKAQPVQWTKAADGRLYSGTGNNYGRAIARQIMVPAGSPTVTLDLEYQTEATWDFAFVQVYDPTDKKWVSLTNSNTTSTADPQALATIRANLPGFTGSRAASSRRRST
jgi:hypothetical protein